MRLKSALMGAAATLVLGTAAWADRGTDGELKITFPQAVSILNPVCSNKSFNSCNRSPLLGFLQEREFN